MIKALWGKRASEQRVKQGFNDYHLITKNEVRMSQNKETGQGNRTWNIKPDPLHAIQFR